MMKHATLIDELHEQIFKVEHYILHADIFTNYLTEKQCAQFRHGKIFAQLRAFCLNDDETTRNALLQHWLGVVEIAENSKSGLCDPMNTNHWQWI